jgi:sugar/nucleoside kinase (ribokinase family)
MNKVCVVGNLNADLILYPLRDYPTWGTEVVTKSMDWRPGGVANALLSLSSLGIGATALANIGSDTIGDEMVSILKESGVDVRHVKRSENVRTAVCVGLGREDGERSFVTYLGHLELFDIDLVLNQRDAWKEAQYILISGYFLLPALGFEGTMRLIDKVHSESKQVILDVGWDTSGWPHSTVQMVLQLVKNVDVFLPSLNEAQEISGESSPESCLGRLYEHCPGSVIIKLGEAGCIAKTEEGTFQHPAFPIKALDTTGAGDSFNAGVIFGFLNEWGVDKTLRFANAVAAMVITRPKGTGYPTFKDVENFLRKNK